MILNIFSRTFLRIPRSGTPSSISTFERSELPIASCIFAKRSASRSVIVCFAFCWATIPDFSFEPELSELWEDLPFALESEAEVEGAEDEYHRDWDCGDRGWSEEWSCEHGLRSGSICRKVLREFKTSFPADDRFIRGLGKAARRDSMGTFMLCSVGVALTLPWCHAKEIEIPGEDELPYANKPGTFSLNKKRTILCCPSCPSNKARDDLTLSSGLIPYQKDNERITIAASLETVCCTHHVYGPGKRPSVQAICDDRRSRTRGFWHAGRMARLYRFPRTTTKGGNKSIILWQV